MLNNANDEDDGENNKDDMWMQWRICFRKRMMSWQNTIHDVHYQHTILSFGGSCNQWSWQWNERIVVDDIEIFVKLCSCQEQFLKEE